MNTAMMWKRSGNKFTRFLFKIQMFSMWKQGIRIYSLSYLPVFVQGVLGGDFLTLQWFPWLTITTIPTWQSLMKPLTWTFRRNMTRIPNTSQEINSWTTTYQYLEKKKQKSIPKVWQGSSISKNILKIYLSTVQRIGKI